MHFLFLIAISLVFSTIPASAEDFGQMFMNSSPTALSEADASTQKPIANAEEMENMDPLIEALQNIEPAAGVSEQGSDAYFDTIERGTIDSKDVFDKDWPVYESGLKNIADPLRK